MRWVHLDSGADAAVAVPETPPRGSVVVAGELFGITDWLLRVLDRLAEAGYVAVAPDFYWRGERRAVLGYDQAGRDRGFALLGAVRPEDVIADVAAARTFGIDRAEGVGGTAMIGFSSGGHMAVLAATRIPFDVVCSIYGGWTLHGGIPLAEPRPPLQDAEAIGGFGTYLLGVVGDQDFLITQAEWQEIDQRLTDAAVDHELITYPGCSHGFLCPDRPESYDADATDDTWRRVFEVLDRRVGRVR